MSTYYMKNKNEMIEYASDNTKSIIVTEETKDFFSGNGFEVKTWGGYMIQMYTSDTPNPKNYGDAVYVNKRTLKAYLRHFTGLKGSELNSELWSLSQRFWSPKHPEIWDKKVLMKCNTDRLI